MQLFRIVRYILNVGHRTRQTDECNSFRILAKNRQISAVASGKDYRIKNAELNELKTVKVFETTANERRNQRRSTHPKTCNSTLLCNFEKDGDRYRYRERENDRVRHRNQLLLPHHRFMVCYENSMRYMEIA